MKRLLLMLLLLVSPAFGSAANFYITQNGAGSANGTSLGNAASCGGSGASTCAAFNNGSNWGSGSTQIGAGTTINISGTITAAANACNYMTFQGSGSSGSPITLLFASGTVLTAPTWGGGCFAIYGNGKSYITVNGAGTGCAIFGLPIAPSTCNSAFTTGGTVQATANGTGLTYQVLGNGLGFYSASNVIVENLVISNIYVHSSATDESGDPTGAIYFQSMANSSMVNNVAHDMKWCLELAYVNGNNNIVFQGNMTYDVDHGVAVGTGTAGSVITGLLVYQNAYHDPANWDDNGNNNHHDGVHLWAPGTGVEIVNAAVYDNYFYGNFGAHMNDAIYMENFVSGANPSVFNNIIAPNAGAAGNGLIGPGANATGQGAGWIVANNTIVEWSNTVATAINSNNTVGTNYNNIVSTPNAAIGGYSSNGAFAIDYNDYYQIGSGGWNGGSPLSAWVSYCVANYTSATGCDTHSIGTNPNLTGGFAPNAGSPVIGTGKNLHSACSGQPIPGLGALCYDAAGNVRPTSTAWTMGALNVGGAAPNPPTGLSLIVE